MTDNWLLNWATLAVSLFNTILLVWLGLTVLLNAERRTWGLWLTGGVILLGGTFFLIHSIILGLGLHAFGQSIDIWWKLGWIPVVTIPYIWYVVILWYSGFWAGSGETLARRHLPWLIGSSLLVAAIVALLVFANPSPSYVQATQLNLTNTLSIAGIPLLILIYPLYILLCMALSVDVMRHPAPSERMMGELARRRAHPWLLGAALTQILVSLLVGWVMVWVANGSRQSLFDPSVAITIAMFDLVIACLIAIAIILLGQAVTYYEIFTGKALPRHGLSQFWYRAVILAGGYAAAVSLSLSLNLHPIYSVLLSALLMTVFYAILSWRSLAERQRFIDQLRPFVTSQHVYEQVISTSPTVVDIDQPFRILCQDVLRTEQAYLAAQGPMASLVGEPVIYSEGQTPRPPKLEGILDSGISQEEICIPLPKQTPGDWRWLVPLWSERGLIGSMLLGEKRGGGLYANEEIEIARTVGERLIDMRASTEIARRLMALQRERLAESQVADRRTRRVLHDEVLPELHAALLSLGASQTGHQDAISALSSAHLQISDLLRDLPVVTAPDVNRLGLLAALRKTLTNEFSSAFDQVVWEIPDEGERSLVELSPLVSEVVYFAARESIRNAARHGAADEKLPTLKIKVNLQARDLEVVIQDKGPGIKESQGKEPGSGKGLELHSTMMAVIGGELSFEQFPGRVAQVTLRVPLAE